MTDHLIIQLTYPEFHFEIETEVDSLTGIQRYNGSVNRFPHLPPVGILPTLASAKPCQGGGLDPLLSANNIGKVKV